MALATRCPHCATTFRVAHDQLKLRAGLVRCGACKQIFNGVENLLGPDVVPVTRPPASPTPPAQQASAAPAVAPVSGTPQKAAADVPSTPSGVPAAAGTAAPSSLILSPPTTAFPSGIAPASQPEEAGKDTDPLTRMTLMDFTAFEERGHPPGTADKAAPASDAETPDEIDKAIEDLRSRPWRGEQQRGETDKGENLTYSEAEEPDFVRHARRRQKRSNTLKWVYGLGSFLLALALAAQLTYTFRDQIAQRLPQTAPLLQQACDRLGCRIDFPAPIHALSIESSELQALPAQADVFLLRVLLRNRYDTTVAWPHLELTLNDAEDKPVAKRSFSPADYLASAEQAQAGFAAQSEQALNMHFTLQGERASGFQVYLFYP